MELTLKDRLILANQYRILEQVGEEGERSYYTMCREALENGFTLEYKSLFQYMLEPPLTEAQCREVIHVLSMYRELNVSYNSLPESERAGINEDLLTFPGYDSNDNVEVHLGMYVRHMVDQPHKWQELKDREGDFNSHSTMQEQYSNMLGIFNQVKVPGKRLTNEDIQAVLKAMYG